VGTIAITGSAGGIGGATRALLEANGHRVIGIDVRDAEVIADLSTPEGRTVMIDDVTAASNGVLDGLVAARSLFHSSMHYRSVMILGEARVIEDPAEVLAALLALSDALIPGRVPEARAPSASELRQTRVVALRIDEASAKVSDSWPGDPPEDVVLDVWAGVIPLEERWGVPRSAPDLPSGIVVSPSITSLADDHRLVRPEGPTG
jgi:hypothetical protein